MEKRNRPTSPELIKQLSDANIMEAFPQEIRDKVKASRFKYFALFEEFKNSLLIIPYFDEVFSNNTEHFNEFVSDKQTSRIQALDPTKKELMSRIIEDIFSLRSMFIDGKSPDFYKVQTVNGVKVDNGIDGEQNGKDENNDNDGEKDDNSKGGEKTEADVADDVNNNNKNNDEGELGALSNVKRKHPKKKKGSKKRSKRGGSTKHKEEKGENKEKWTGKQEVQPFKKKLVKINGKFMTWPYPPTDEEKLHIDYGLNREHMDKVCRHMEGFCDAIIDIIETDFYKSRDHVFRGLADIFGKLAEPLNVKDTDYEKLKAIVELVSSVTTSKEDYSSYGAGTAQCEAHMREMEEKEEGVIIKDVTGLDQAAIEAAHKKGGSSSSEEESDNEKTSCTCPCHGPCPCCCSGCYMLNHQDLIEQNNGHVVKIVKKGFGILPDNRSGDVDADGVLTGPRIEEIVDEVDEEVKRINFQEGKQEQNTFNLRGTRNTKLWEAAAAADDSMKKALDENAETVSSAESNSSKNRSNGNKHRPFDNDVPTSSVEDENEANDDVEQSAIHSKEISKNVSSNPEYPLPSVASDSNMNNTYIECLDRSKLSDCILTVQTSDNKNVPEPLVVIGPEQITIVDHNKEDGEAADEKRGDQINKEREKHDKSPEAGLGQSRTYDSFPIRKKKKNKEKSHMPYDFESSDKCSHCCCHCGCNRQFNIEMPSLDDPEAFAISFLEELTRFSPANRTHVFDMATLIAAEQSRNTLKQKVVEVCMKYCLRSLKELKVSFHLYIMELVFKILMSTSYARKYCYRDPDFFPAISRLLGVLDPCKNRDKNQLRGDAAHVLYVTLMGGPREAFEKVAETDSFMHMISILHEEPNNRNDAQSAEDVFMCFMLFTDEWDLFIVYFKAAPMYRLIKHWRRYALEYTAHLPNFIWTLETLRKRLQVLFEAYRNLRFDIRLPKTFAVEKLEKHYETACSYPKCFKVNFTEFQSKYKKCSRCHLAYYCSKECQLSHWKKHRKWCEKPDWLIEEERQAEIDKAIENIDFTGKILAETEASDLEQEASV